MLVQLVWKPFSMQYLVIAGRIQDSKVEDREVATQQKMMKNNNY